jgi:hypothetical protein
MVDGNGDDEDGDGDGEPDVCDYLTCLSTHKLVRGSSDLSVSRLEARICSGQKRVSSVTQCTESGYG